MITLRDQEFSLSAFRLCNSQTNIQWKLGTDEPLEMFIWSALFGTQRKAWQKPSCNTFNDLNKKGNSNLLPPWFLQNSYAYQCLSITCSLWLRSSNVHNQCTSQCWRLGRHQNLPRFSKVRVNLGLLGISECILGDSMIILHLYQMDFNYIHSRWTQWHTTRRMILR